MAGGPAASDLSGRLYDGRSAAARLVRVAAGPEGLDLHAEGMEPITWPITRLVRLKQEGGELRLGLSDEPEARLIMDAAAAPVLRVLLPSLMDGKRERRKALMLGAGLVGAALAMVGLVFGVMPMAAEPLAAMTPPHVEETIGSNVARQVQVVLKPCRGAQAEAAEAAIAPLMADLEAAADAGFPVTLTFVRMDAPNALALPGGHVKVTSGLLETLETPDELAAVIAHEIGHVRARDGMVGLYRHAGLGILLEIITGGSGVAQQIVLLSGQLTEMRYTRAQEARADEAALQILGAAGYNPAALADAFRRLQSWVDAEKAEDAAKGGPAFEVPEWFQSHPDLKSRIARAAKEANPNAPSTMTPAAWATVRAACDAHRAD